MKSRFLQGAMGRITFCLFTLLLTPLALLQAQTVYEADASGNAIEGTATKASCAKCLDGEEVTGIGNGSANYLRIKNISETKAGNYTVTLFYLINGSSSFSISINGGAQTTLNVTGTSTTVPASTTFTAAFTASSTNSVGFFNASKAAPAVDHIVVTPAGGTTTVATPVISPGTESFTSSVSVTISDSTSGSTIYYTTNGTTPTTSSTKYSSAISVSATETIEAIAVLSGDTNSAVASATYTKGSSTTVATPVLSPGSETFTSSVSVTISDSTSGSTIYYTTNGTTPTTSSTKYSSAISVSATETIEAIAVLSGDTNSAVASATYTKSTTTSGKILAPFDYVQDLSSGNASEIPGDVTAAGLKAVILAFLIPNGSSCALTWGSGSLPSDSVGGTSMATVISKLQADGITVGISQGGYGGQEGAAHCSTAAATQALYQQIITLYHVNWLDFDIEYTETSGQSTRRAQALAALQKANPGLQISFTLAADSPSDGNADGIPTGSGGGTTDVTDAIAAGVNLTYINGMAMDFSSNTTDQATLAEQSAAAIESWIKSQGISATVGITTLIGAPDSPNTKDFTLADATTLTDWAKGESYVTLMSFWELNRDNGSCAGTGDDPNGCSGITQTTYEFSDLFGPF